MSQYSWVGNLVNQVKGAFGTVKAAVTPNKAPAPAPVSAASAGFKTITPQAAQARSVTAPGSAQPAASYQYAPAGTSNPPGIVDWNALFGPSGGVASGGSSRSSSPAASSYSGGSSPSWGSGGDFGGFVHVPPPPMPEFHAKLPAFDRISKREWKPGDPATTSPGTPPPAAYVRDKQKYAKLIGEEV